MGSDGNPYFTLMERLHTELEPITHDEEFPARSLVDYFHEVKSFVATEEGDGKGNGKAAKLALKALGKAGKVGKVAAGIGKKGLKAKKKLAGGKSAEQLESLVEPGAKSFEAYRAALSTAAFAADSRPQSATTMVTLFTTPDTPEAGTGPMAEAEKAVMALETLIGKPNAESQVFWHLYSGALRVAYEYMREETACHLQDQWDKTVLSELEGVATNKIGNALIGEGGLVWKYIDGNAVAFLQKRQLRGYQPAQVNGKSIPWTTEFMEFANNGSVGRNLVNGEYTVRLSAFPTGVNQSASTSPYSAILNLQCADGVQTLPNYNYNAIKDFKWSLEKCGDVTLAVQIGQLTLRKEYKGEKAFPQFLTDFRDGHKVMVAEEFPDLQAQLRNLNVRAVDVNYQISGQDPLIQILRSVPLAAPSTVTTCWQ
jgi:type VI secretion system protein ImpL